MSTAASRQLSVDRTSSPTIRAYSGASSTIRRRRDTKTNMPPFFALFSKDISDGAANRSQESRDRARRPLLQRPAVHGTEPRRDAVAFLEVLRVDRAAFHRLQVRHAAELDGFETSRDREVLRGQHARSSFHEV